MGGMLSMRASEFIHFWNRQFRVTGASNVLVVLLVADGAFICLHFLLLTSLLNSPLFSLERDWGYAERYQYIKELCIAGLLLSILVKTRTSGYGVWALLFLYLLLDDALQVHERLGGYLAGKLEVTPFLGLRARDAGELIVSATCAALFLPLLLAFYVRGSEAFKLATRHLLLLLLGLAFFGVGVDMVHVVTASYLLGTAEEGGELLVMTVIASYVFLLHIRDGDIRSDGDKGTGVPVG